VFFVARSLFGDLVGTAAAVLLLFNHDFSRLSSLVACEALLTPLVVAGWYFAVRGLNRHKLWMLAGAILGLAYLTKASGVLVFGLLAAGCALATHGRILKRKAFWIGVVLFLVVASPLLVRNAVVFHNPVYNINTAHVAWFDSHLQFFAPATWTDPPTMGSYLRAHSLAEVTQRIALGLGAQAIVFTKSLSPTSGALSFPLGVCVLVLGLLAGFADPDRPRRLATGALFAGVYVAVAWYTPMFSAARFMFPLVPIWLAYGAAGLSGLTARIARRWAPAPRGQSVAVLLVAFGAGALAFALHLRPGTTAEVARSYRYAKGATAIREWAEDNVRPGDRVCHGPDHGYLHRWDSRAEDGRYANWHPVMNPHSQWHLVPAHDHPAELLAYLKLHQIRYLVITRDTFRELRVCLGKAFSWDRKEGLVQTRELPGLRVVLRDTPPPAHFLVYEVQLENQGAASAAGRRAEERPVPPDEHEREDGRQHGRHEGDPPGEGERKVHRTGRRPAFAPGEPGEGGGHRHGLEEGLGLSHPVGAHDTPLHGAGGAHAADDELPRHEHEDHPHRENVLVGQAHEQREDQDLIGERVEVVAKR